METGSENNKRIKIVADSGIPFLRGVLEPFADVLYKEGAAITREDLMDASALLTRTRTKCNRELLEGTSVKIIATATIGTDHIDTDWCNGAGILVRNAAGCNAGGVMEYVFSAIYGTAARKSINLSGKTLAIIGVGHVGKRVLQMFRYLGFNVLQCDPPRAAAEGDFQFVSREYLLEHSDIVTMHVPLDDTTKGMCDEAFFSRMKDGTIFVNASRGEIVDEDALLRHIGRLGPVIIDTWKNEPDINLALMEKVYIATPHIAGYSYQGKQNGTSAAVRAVAHYFGFTDLYEFFPPTEFPENEAVKLDLKGKTQGEIAAVIQYNYPIFTDDFMFRLEPGAFERLRTEYKYRREVYVD